MKLEFANKKFALLDKKRDKFLLIIIVFIFSVFFINAFKPWNIGRWHSDSGLIQFLRLSSYGLVVALVLFFTQFPLRYVFKQSEFKIKTYISWVIIEISLISLVYIFLYGNPLGNFINDFIFSVKYTLLGICIPYSFALLIIHYKNQRQQIVQLQNRITHPSDKKLIAFKDENGKVKFSVSIKDLLFLESSDNYVSVFYILENKVQRELLRNTMKNIEQSLKDSVVIRCHRSFMVNLDNIEFIKKAGKKLNIKVRLMDKTISVSNKYAPHFLTHLS